MILDFENKEIQIKIVYYGPAMSGKTTSLKFLFSYFGKEKVVESINNSTGRTLFFDFGVLEFKGIEWGVKFLIFTATGQDFYMGTRPATLNGVDGIIFVADSQIQRLESNVSSWNELKMLFEHDLYDIPIVIAWNKSDLENKYKLNIVYFKRLIEFNKFKNLFIIETIAINGEGILSSFKQLINILFPETDLEIFLSI